MTFTVKNQGNSPSAAFTGRVFIATSSSNTNIFLASVNINPIPSGATQEVTVNVIIPQFLSPGDYYITAFADALRCFVETNENNNIGSAPMNVTYDTTPPTGSILINGGAAWTNSTAVTLSLTYSDTLSGVDKVRYSMMGYGILSSGRLPQHLSHGPWQVETAPKLSTIR